MYKALYAPVDFATHRGTANKLKKNGLYEKAVKYYTKALDTKKDVRCFLDRSVCHMKLGHPMNALADAEMAMYLDRNNYRAFLQKAEALFLSGDFETALVFYYRGRRMRPDVQQFSVGIQNATQAIKNCVGTPETIKLTLKGDLTYFHDKLDPAKALRKIMSLLKGSGMNLVPRSSSMVTPKRDVNKSPSHQKTVHQLLGQMYTDHKYLENVLENMTGCTPSDADILSITEEGLKYLDKRADFWRNQRPIYSMLYDQKLFRWRFGRNTDAVGDMDILLKMEQIEEDMKLENYQRVLTTAQSCLKMLKQYTKLPNKPALQGQLHSSLGTAFLELGQHADAMMHHEKDLALAQKHKIAEGVARATDNIGRVHFNLGDYKQAIQLWKKRLSEPNSEAEGMWLSQQLCKSYLKLDKPRYALLYARPFVGLSGLDDMRWVLQGNVLAGQCKLKLGELGESLACFSEALDVAKRLDDLKGRKTLEEIIIAINKRIKLSSIPESSEQIQKIVTIIDEAHMSASDRKVSESILKSTPQDSAPQAAQDSTTQDSAPQDNSP